MDEVVFSIEQGSEILRNTAMMVGYDRMTAEQAVQSALWLERRGGDGVSIFIVHLLLNGTKPFQALKPIVTKQGALECLCPFMAARAIAKQFQSGLPNPGFRFRGPSAPPLMAPLLVNLAARHNKAVRLHYPGTTVRFGETGIGFESPMLSTYALVGDKCDHWTAIEFIDLFNGELAAPLTTITLPKNRLIGSGKTLNLSDRPRRSSMH